MIAYAMECDQTQQSRVLRNDLLIILSICSKMCYHKHFENDNNGWQPKNTHIGC